MDEITSTKNFFKAHHITLSDYWLESCIEWFREENPTLSYTLETLHSTVYAQWLLLDLRDVEVPILPQNIQQKKFVLNNTFCLQMLQIQDISQPKYHQIQKIRNSSLLVDASINQDYKPTVAPKRMLQMLLTDGVQEIESIEYKPIKALNINLKPGTKIRIKGPVTVRRGQILLEEQHVYILGGEVEELLVSNAYENVLARALKLPENPKPDVVEESIDVVNEELVTVVNTTNIINQYPGNRNLNISSASTLPLNSRNANNINQLNTQKDDFDEIFISNEIDMLLEAERDIANEAGGSRHRFDNDLFLKAENNVPGHTALKPPAPSIIPNGTSKSEPNLDDTIFADLDLDTHLDMIDQQQATKPVIDQVVSIKNLLNVTCGQFIIKAKFKTVVRKLTVNDNSWLLKITVSDESGDLVVKVDSKVVSNLTGYAPSAIMNLRKDITNKDKNATTALMKILSDLKEKLVKLDGKLRIQFIPEEECFSIIEIL